jgi:LuxR family maltose regulon positive regulatory protein
MQTSVLLVDDHAVFRQGLSLLLEQAGELNIIAEAGDGRTAIELARQHRPDLILMDISLPDLSGVEATRQILAANPDTRIVALSIHGKKRYIDSMLGAGADGYILKESAPEELIEGIRAVMDGRKYLSANLKQVVVSGYMEFLNGEQAMEEQESESSSISLLNTKLYAPSLSQNMVSRPRLIEKLEAGRWRPMTLVCAPAGYGKSTLVSQWLNSIERDCPGVWFSLDENDNDPHAFMTYLTAAVQTEFPEALHDSSRLLSAPALPSLQVLTRTLMNELGQIPQRFILVLDDYHNIVEPSIHELLAELLRHPPQIFHLVLVTRTDPPLDLLKLLAYQRMSEVRARALIFTVQETADLLKKVTGSTVDENIVQALIEKTEGWVTGLHLMTFSVKDSDNLARLSKTLPGEQHTLDYMAAEALSRQSHQVQSWLLQTSILDRFCAPLCQAVCLGFEDSQASSLNGESFIQWLVGTNLFVVPLDPRGRWFRYHHLFQELLQKQLQKALDAEQIASRYARASQWFAENGMIGEAIEHALAAGDTVGAAEIVERVRHEEHEAARWHVVEGWLAKLPTWIKQERPRLILAEAWIAFTKFQLERIPPMLEQAESLLGGPNADPLLSGELNFFRGNISYWLGEIEVSVQYLEEALAQIAGRQTHVESNIELMLALARHSNGQRDAAIQAIRERIRAVNMSQGFLLSFLHAGLAFIYLLSGELDKASVQVQQMQTANSKIDNLNTQAWHEYMQAGIQLQTCKLEDAAYYFNLAAQQRYILDTAAVIDALAGLALAQQLHGRAQASTETVARALELARELNDPNSLSVAYSSQARISLLKGDLAEADLWARREQPTPAPASLFLWTEVPVINQARVLIAIGTEESLKEASRLLMEIRAVCETNHFTNQVIEIAVLGSLTLEKQGRADEALHALEEALVLATPGGWIRPFVELGQPMAGMLERLKQAGVSGSSQDAHLDRILAVFRTLAASPPVQSGLVEPLTDRELQVLRLLASSLSTRDLSDELVVSVNTVRMHTKNIYRKLDVHSRSEAVERTRKLGLI